MSLAYEEYRKRKEALFRRADEVTGGALCRDMPTLIKKQGALVKELLARGDILKARTEVERLLSYVSYSEFCEIR